MLEINGGGKRNGRFPLKTAPAVRAARERVRRSASAACREIRPKLFSDLAFWPGIPLFMKHFWFGSRNRMREITIVHPNVGVDSSQSLATVVQTRSRRTGVNYPEDLAPGTVGIYR